MATNFNLNHPERRKGEAFWGNVEHNPEQPIPDVSAFGNPWNNFPSTARVGTVGYDVHGTKNPGLLPIFASAREILGPTIQKNVQASRSARLRSKYPTAKLAP